MLDALDQYSLQTKRPITLPLLREVLQHAQGVSRRGRRAVRTTIGARTERVRDRTFGGTVFPDVDGLYSTTGPCPPHPIPAAACIPRRNACFRALMRLALFDLDNTLLAGDSDFEWAQFLIEKGVLDREVYEARNQSSYEQYKAGTLDIHEFLDFQLKPLSRHPRKVLDEWHREFMRDRILPDHHAQVARPGGEPPRDVRAIVTATNSFVTGADRARVRHRSPDRDRAGGGGRRVHRQA